MEKAYDYVIVGAGSAGCVLAYRLGQDPGARILVLEAGGQDRSPMIKIPLTWGLILKRRLFDWGYFTEAEPGMDGRRIECSRGRVVGGSSSINGMMYSRGMAEDYDGWAEEFGLRDWSHARVLPFFRRSESWEDGESATRGGDGPLTVKPLRFVDPLVDAFLAATDQAGYPQTADYNGDHAEGFGPMQATIRRGLRCSAAVAFLRPAMARGNVTLRTGALASRVRFEGNRAVGVEYWHGGKARFARAEREVALAGGVMNSPQLLMLSGIGDPEQLASHGIATRVALPGVGRNLQDHVVCDVRWRRRGEGPLHRALRLDRIGLDVARTALFGGRGQGMASQVPAASIGLVRSDPATVAVPDALFILAAGPMNAAPHLGPVLPAYVDAFGIKGVMLQPESRGEVTLASADPVAAPIIRQNFLSTEGDRRTIRAMVRRMRAIGAEPALRPFVAEELAPGPAARTDADIDAFVRRAAITLHHPVGTCRMGVDGDPDAVLDDQARVRGVDGLRVVDGAAIPRTVRGGTNAPIMMIAEKVADRMLGNTA